MIHQIDNNRQSSSATIIVCTGDVILDVPEPDHWLGGIAPALRKANLTLGHLEVPHSSAGFEQSTDIPAPGADPEHLAALSRAGFDVMTLAGNHIGDCGAQGIADTLSGLDALDIKHCGAGMNLTSSRSPALFAIDTRQLAVLSYNCVGPESGWASDCKPGCAYLPVATADGGPVAPAKILSAPQTLAMEILQQDISVARKQAALVIVALHKGIVHTPAVIADYELVLARAAIDAGADIVIGHHAHIIRGIEFYKGRPIFHGLGNGCVVTHALDPNQQHVKRAQWAERRKKLFGFEPDPEYFLAPFHPEAVNGFMAKILWHEDGAIEAGIIPVHVDPPGRPRLANEDEVIRVCAYLQKINLAAGLAQLKLTPRDDMVLVHESES